MSASPSRPKYDQVFLDSRREAIIIFCVWAVCLIWSVSYCYRNGYGYGLEPDDLHLVMGMPSWIFWGVAIPWLCADVFTIWFCMAYMRDGDLGSDPPQVASSSDTQATRTGREA